LHRQPQAGDWETAVAEVFRDLRGRGNTPTEVGHAAHQPLAAAATVPGRPPEVLS